jgi:hypothetical protein
MRGTPCRHHRQPSTDLFRPSVAEFENDSGLIWIYSREKLVRGLSVKDYQASLEKLRKDAAEAAMIRDLATDPNKRDMFDRLHQHLSRLAN